MKMAIIPEVTIIDDKIAEALLNTFKNLLMRTARSILDEVKEKFEKEANLSYNEFVANKIEQITINKIFHLDSEKMELVFNFKDSSNKNENENKS